MKIFITSIILCLILFGELSAQADLPTEESQVFSGSGNCVMCHTAGVNGALVYNDEDVSPVNYWKSTMMGNASKDPLWRAVVAGEVEDSPVFRNLIESKCSRCHIPAGYTQSVFNGASGYSFDQIKSGSLDNDGVTCTVCHQITVAKLGTQESFTGGYVIGKDRLIYGPYEDPFTRPMMMHVNYTPILGQHQVNKSEFCATCHTLFTNYIGKDGKLSDDLFAEQTPYLEWQNSIYPANNISCQSCHMPEIDEPIKISRMPMMLSERSPYLKHTFAGANVFTPSIIRDNIDELSATADSEDYNMKIAQVYENLSHAFNLSVFPSFKNDRLCVDVKLENLTGHKLPTAHPFRRMWIHLTARDNSGKVVFESGRTDSQGEIAGLDKYFEPHHSIITDEGQVQIYQAIFTDEDGQVSTKLLKAKEYIKDNRIPPKGFISSHANYKITPVTGSALQDNDFNSENGVEGSGTDLVQYRIAAEKGAIYNVDVEVCYQSTQPLVVNSLRNVKSIYAQSFFPIYDKNGNKPVIMKTASVRTAKYE